MRASKKPLLAWRRRAIVAAAKRLVLPRGPVMPGVENTECGRWTLSKTDEQGG